MIKKLFNRFIIISFILNGFLPFSVFADDDIIRRAFRDELVAGVGQVLINSPIVSGDGFVKYILMICVVIAIFQTFYRKFGQRDFVVEWTKLLISLMIALSILGISKFKLQVFSTGKAATANTLDMNIFYGFSDIFDKLANDIIPIEYAGGADAYQHQFNKAHELLQGAKLIVDKCKLSSDPSCVKTKLEKIGKPGYSPFSDKIDDKNDQSIFTIVAKKFLDAFDLVNMFSNLSFVFISIASWALDLIRMALNYFTIISFSLMTALSLFFCKIITPFIVIPNFRNDVLRAYKMPLSATMYGFFTSLIILLGTIVMSGVNRAAIKALQEKAAVSGDISTSDFMHILFGVSLAMLSVTALQVIVITKVPKMCRQLLDLSFQEVVELGKAMVEAGYGIGVMTAKITGTAVTGVAGLGAGAALGKIAGGTFGTIAGGIGSKMPGGSNGGGSLANLSSRSSKSDGMHQWSPNGSIMKNGDGSPLWNSNNSSSQNDSSNSSKKTKDESSNSPRNAGASIGLRNKKSANEEQKDKNINDDKILENKKIRKLIEEETKLEKQGSKSQVSSILNLGKNVAKSAGWLASTGLRIGMGKDVDIVSDISSGTSKAIKSHTDQSKEINKAYSAKKKVTEEKNELIKEEEEKIAKENEEISQANMGGMFNEAALIQKDAKVDAAEMSELADSIRSGKASSQEFAQFRKTINNANPRAMKNLDNSTRMKIKLAQSSNFYKDFEKQAEADRKAVIESAILSDSEGNITGLDGMAVDQVTKIMQDSLITRGDYNEVSVQKLAEASRVQKLNETESRLNNAIKDAEEMRQKGKIAEARKVEAQISKLNNEIDRINQQSGISFLFGLGNKQEKDKTVEKDIPVNPPKKVESNFDKFVEEENKITESNKSREDFYPEIKKLMSSPEFKKLSSREQKIKIEELKEKFNK